MQGGMGEESGAVCSRVPGTGRGQRLPVRSNACGKVPWHWFWCPANVRSGTPSWTHRKRRDSLWGEQKRFLASAEARLFARNTCRRQERG